MKNNSIYIKKQSIVYFCIFTYFIVISAFRLTYGIDSQLGKITLGLLILSSLFILKKIKIFPFTIWLLCFWGWYYISSIWSLNVTDVFYYFMSFVKILILSIIIPQLIKNNTDSLLFLKMIVGSLLIAIVVLFIKTPLNAWGTERVGAAIGLNANDLGLRCSFGFIISYYFLEKIKNYKSNSSIRRTLLRLIIIISMILFLIVILYSGSKKALFCLLFGLIFYIVTSTKSYKRFGKIIILFFLLIVLWNVINNNEKIYNVLGKRVESYVQYTFKHNSSPYDVSTVEREFFRNEAFDLFKKNWLIGVGGNGFVTHLRNIGYSHIAYSHNNYFELLATLGILGFTIYYSLFIKIIKDICKFVTKDKLYTLYLSIILCFLICDYGCVTYFEQFNMVLLLIVTTSLYNVKRSKKNE